MRIAWLVVVGACAKHDKTPAPAPGSAAVAPAPVGHTKLVGCAPAQLAPRGERPAGEEHRAAARGRVGDVKVWTPYAAGEGLAPADIATAAATELESAIRGKLAKLDECIGEHTGSLRAVLFVAFDGGVISARVGGMGDHHVDACVAGALIGLKVGAPPIVSEVACDLSRGAPAPWRVTEDGGYDVTIAARRDEVSAAGPVDAGEHSVLVVADADAPASQISKAIDSVAVRNAVVVGVRVDAGAPVFLGVGFDARTERGADGEPIAIDTRGAPHACVDGEAIGTGTPQQLATALAGRCKTDPCGTLSLPLTGTLAAKETMTYATAAREAGFTRILVGGEGCTQSESESGSSSGTGISSGGSGLSDAGGSAPSIAKPSSR